MAIAGLIDFQMRFNQKKVLLGSPSIITISEVLEIYNLLIKPNQVHYVVLNIKHRSLYLIWQTARQIIQIDFNPSI